MDAREREAGPRREPACCGCGQATSRRRFLGQVSGTLVGTLLASELGRDAAALPVAEGTASHATADERRYSIPAADGVTIDRDAQIILVRSNAAIYAFNLACPHENTALRWRAQDNRFQCPRHESKYQPDGTFMEGRATRNMDRFPVARAGNEIVVDVSRLLRSDHDAAAWSAAVVKL